MPLTAKGSEILSHMEKTYGAEKGKSVFYASRNAGKITGVDAKDMSGPEWDKLSKLFGEWIEEERDEPEHAADERLAFDFQPPEKSKRKYDENGYLHVPDTNISKACVNPYRGNEIPGWEALKLQPDKIYHLLRDPEELAKAASSFDNMPLLRGHPPVGVSSAHEHISKIGSTGTGTRFVDPYLVTDLVIWDDGPIAGVEHNVQRELSSSYRYRADMTPGRYQDIDYDGVMRDIRGNHVALVEAGRAGPDVVVGDAALVTRRKSLMPAVRLTRKGVLAFGAVTGFLAAKGLAKDASLDSIKSSLADVTNKNWKIRKPGIAAAVHSTAAQNGIAMDAALKDINLALDELDEEEAEDEDLTDRTGLDEAETEEEAKDRKARRARDRAMDRDCASDEEPETEEEKEHRKEARDRRAKDKRMGKDADPEEREEAEKEHKAEDVKAWDARMAARDKRAKDKAKDTEAMDRAAMDAALRKMRNDTRTETIAHIRAITEAERAVLPFVGPVDGMAMDSAADVYKFALEKAGIDLTGVPVAAFKAMVGMLPLPGSQPTPKFAQDSGVASHEAFHASLMAD